MTDDEIRQIGSEFIEGRKGLLKNNPYGFDEQTVAMGNVRWRYIDPLRMGLYVLVKNASHNGCWAVDFDHIAHLCTNPSAFKQEPPADSARISDPVADELVDF